MLPIDKAVFTAKLVDKTKVLAEVGVTFKVPKADGVTMLVEIAPEPPIVKVELVVPTKPPVVPAIGPLAIKVLVPKDRVPLVKVNVPFAVIFAPKATLLEVLTSTLFKTELEVGTSLPEVIDEVC